MIKGVTHAHLGPIWYHSEPSDFPYPQNQFHALDFFVVSYSNTALVREIKHKRTIGQNNKPAKGLHIRQTQYYILAKHS